MVSSTTTGIDNNSEIVTVINSWAHEDILCLVEALQDVLNKYIDQDDLDKADVADSLLDAFMVIKEQEDI